MTEKLIGAIEAGGTKFVLAVSSQDGQVMDKARIDTGIPAETFRHIQAYFEAAEQKFGPISGIGIASFGPIDVDPSSSTYGTFTTTPKPGWSGARIQDAVRGVEAPILIDTDVNGAALGEWLAGAGQDCETLAYTTVGTGIGSGVLHRGMPRSGIGHLEAGHIRPPRDPARDPYEGHCPYHGDCLEGLACGPAVIDRWGAPLNDVALDNSDAVPLIASYLAEFASSLVLLHMPDRLVFGGGVMKTPGLFDSLREQVENLLGGYVQHPRLDPGLQNFIVAPRLGDDAGMTGAIELGKRASRQSSD